MVEIDRELAEQWRYEALPGINLPITYLGKPLRAWWAFRACPPKCAPLCRAGENDGRIDYPAGRFVGTGAFGSRRYQEEFLLERYAAAPNLLI